MTDRTHVVREAVPAFGARMSRRRMFAVCAGIAVAGPALAACSPGNDPTRPDPDALIALADQAHADAALAGAAVAADPELGAELDPLRAARAEHAAALDGAAQRPTPPPAPPVGPDQADRDRVIGAVVASARSAAGAVATAPTEQLGLLADVFACCAAYGDPRAAMEGVQVPNTGPPDESATRIAVEALQRALAGEHAAIWALSLASAFVQPDWAARARSDVEAHKRLRTTFIDLLSRQGQRPVSAQPAYAPPQPVVDGPSAGALLVAAESDVTAALRSLVERASTPKLRVVTLGWMAESAGRSAFWRSVTDRAPAIPAFPGRK